MERPDDVAAALVDGGHPPTRLAVEQEDLEAHFLRLTGPAPADATPPAPSRRPARPPGSGSVSGLVPPLRVELLKARRSIAPLLTALAACIAPLVGGLFMYILADPERARRMGIIGQKAQLAGGGSDWPAYFALLGQAVTVGGFVLFAFVVSWVFGREFSDGTVRYLLALPTSRSGDDRRQVRRRRPLVRRAHGADHVC